MNYNKRNKAHYLYTIEKQSETYTNLMGVFSEGILMHLYFALKYWNIIEFSLWEAIFEIIKMTNIKNMWNIYLKQLL